MLRLTNARVDLAKSIERRLAAAEDQIASAEASAVKEVRDQSVLIAVAAAREVIAKQMTAADGNALIDDAITQVQRQASLSFRCQPNKEKPSHCAGFFGCSRSVGRGGSQIDRYGLNLTGCLTVPRLVIQPSVARYLRCGLLVADPAGFFRQNPYVCAQLPWRGQGRAIVAHR